MAAEGGEQGSPIVKLGIYDRLKKVPPFSSPKTPRVLLSSRGRKMDSTEKAAETAARRMVEDHFKQENNDAAADPLADFILIERNEFPHRGQKQQEEEDIAVCACMPLDGDADSTCGRQCLNALNNAECRATHCPCGERCQNQRFQRNQYAKVKLAKTTNKGFGLAAEEDLKAGDFVIEYCGEVVPTKEAHFRSKVYGASGVKDSYIVSLSGGEFVDATRKGSMGRFVNHSCEPNCEMKRWTVLGEDRLGIFAAVDISAGKELTYDYLISQWYGGASKVPCACGTKSCVGILGLNPKGLPQRDAYEWEDDAEKNKEKELQLSADEDDAPLSSLIKGGLVAKKLKGVSNTKGGGVALKNAARENVTTVPATSTVVTETPLPVKDPPQADSKAEDPVLNPAEISALVRRSRNIVTRRGENPPKIANVIGKLKEAPPESILRRGGITKLHGKPNTLEEEEIKVARKRAKSDAEAQGVEGTTVASAEQMLSDNLSRVTAFQRARNTFNKQILDESISCFPISEAACAEVEFAQEMEMAAVSDHKKVCDDIQPAVQEFQKAGQEVSPAVTQKWMEAHCKKLRSSLNFHYSIVRHLAGPTFTLSQPRD